MALSVSCTYAETVAMESWEFNNQTLKLIEVLRTLL
jgi:hypothetical protein